MSTRTEMWAFDGPSIADLRDMLTPLLGLRFEEFYSDEWGYFFSSTPLGETPDIGIYPNAEDEDGTLYVTGHPEVTSLIDAAGLDDSQFRAIESLGGTPIEQFGDFHLSDPGP